MCAFAALREAMGALQDWLGTLLRFLGAIVLGSFWVVSGSFSVAVFLQRVLRVAENCATKAGVLSAVCTQTLSTTKLFILFCNGMVWS